MPEDSEDPMSTGNEAESCAETISGSLYDVRQAMMAVQNALETDACAESWDGAIFPASDLLIAAENLQARIADQYRKAEEAGVS